MRSRPIAGGGVSQAAGDVRYAQLGAANTFTGAPQTIAPAVNTSAINITDQTHTASAPFGTWSQTWNNVAVAFIGMVMAFTNTASAAGSAFIQWTLAGVARISILRGDATSSWIAWGAVGGGNPMIAMNGTSTGLVVARQDGVASFLDMTLRRVMIDATITAGGTTGDRTINKGAGTVNIAAAGSSVTVTNSLVTASTLIFVVVRTNDTTALVKNVVAGAGSFVITMNAAVTAETSIGFFLFN